MRITKTQMRRIINEEMLAVKLNRQLLNEQNKRILNEYRLLVEKRQDFDSLLLTEILRGQLGKDFDIWKIDEGLWDSLKNKLKKMAVFARSRNLEKGGKLDIAGLFGSNKKLDQARDDMVKHIAKLAKTQMEAFMKKMKEAHPDFPNENSEKEFRAALEEVAQVYDSLRAGVEKDPAIAETADAMVAGLRSYLKFILDNKLGDTGKHFVKEAENDENKWKPDWEKGGQKDSDEPETQDALVPAERTDISKIQKSVVPGEPPKGSALERVMAGEKIAADLDSTVIAGLKSNFAPKALGLAGAAAGLMSLLLVSPWFQGLLSQLAGGGSGATGATSTITTALSPDPGEGFTQMLGRLTQGNPNAFGPNTNPAVLFKAMKSLGIDPSAPTELFALGVDKGAYAAARAAGGTTLGSMFPASNQNLWLDLGKSATSTVTNAIKKKAGSGAIAGIAGAALAAAPIAASVLGPLGIALVAGGAAVKLLRMKSLKTSRAQLLNDLASKMVPFGKATGPIPPEVIPNVTPVVTPSGVKVVTAPEDPKQPEKQPPGKPADIDRSKAKNIFYQHGRDNSEQFAKQLHKLERAAKIDKVGLMGVGEDEKVIPLRPLKVKRGKKQLATHPDQLQPKYISSKKATPEQVEYYEEFARGVRDGYITARDNGKDWAQKIKLTEDDELYEDELYEDELYENQSKMGVDIVKEGIAIRREKSILSKWNKIAGIS